MKRTQAPSASQAALSPNVICAEAFRKIQNQEFQSAAKLLQGVLKTDPHHKTALQYLSAAYGALEHHTDQADVLKRLGKIDPDNPVYLLDMSSLEARRPGGGQAALKLAYKASQQNPNSAYAIIKYAIMLRDMGHFDKAEAIFWLCANRFPEEKSAWAYIADLTLARGDFVRGTAFQKLQPETTAQSVLSQFQSLNFSQWRGEALSAEHLLCIYVDVSAADWIHHARYLTPTIQLCSQVVILRSPGLTDLVEHDPRWSIVDQPPHDPADAAASKKVVLMSQLPGLFASRQDVHRTPFAFKAQPFSIPVTRQKNIGLHWALTQQNPRHFAIEVPFQDLRPVLEQSVLEQPDLCFHALQHNTTRDQLEETFPSFNALKFHTHAAQSYKGMASLIAAMDAVITIDDWVAQLSVSMGKKTIVLLPKYASWVWGLSGTSTTYPSAHLCRQSEHLKWTQPIQKALKLIS